MIRKITRVPHINKLLRDFCSLQEKVETIKSLRDSGASPVLAARMVLVNLTVYKARVGDSFTAVFVLIKTAC